MEPGASAPTAGGGEGPSSSTGGGGDGDPSPHPTPAQPTPSPPPQQDPSPKHPQQPLSRYESQKRRDWNTFLQYLKSQKPPVTLARCGGAHVVEFLKYLDQFGKTKVHAAGCPYFGHPSPPAPCDCPLKQAWGSLDALIGRLRAAYEENGGSPESNPFAARAIASYLREVRESQAKARGIPYEKKKRKRSSGAQPSATSTVPAAGVEIVEVSGGESSSTAAVTASSTVTSTATATTATTTTTIISAAGDTAGGSAAEPEEGSGAPPPRPPEGSSTS